MHFVFGYMERFGLFLFGISNFVFLSSYVNHKKEAAENGSRCKLSFEETYNMGKLLGEGAFSIVREATHKETGEKLAVKIIKKRGLSNTDQLLVRSEVSILTDLKHPNIVSMVDSYECRREFKIVFELLRKFL